MNLLYVAALLAVFIAFPIWAISDAVTQPRELWRDRGRSRALWIAVQCIFWFFGSVAYALAIRPTLTQPR